MTFFDTNVLIYFSINQDSKKLELARQYIFSAIEAKKFFISPLILSEYIFVLSKYKIIQAHKDKVISFSKYGQASIDSTLVREAYELCAEIDFCKNINDVIHLKIAEQYCRKLVTFDSDFKKLQPYTTIEIEVIK